MLSIWQRIKWGWGQGGPTLKPPVPCIPSSTPPYFIGFLPLTLFLMPTPVGFRETIAMSQWIQKSELFRALSSFGKSSVRSALALLAQLEARTRIAQYLRKCGTHPSAACLSAPQAYQCKITQSTGMATQMQLEVILAGNCIATSVFWRRDNLRRKAEIVSVSVLTKVLSLD